MRSIRRIFAAATAILLLPVVTAAQQPLRWQPTLESAKRLAVQTDRLVLVHFWADWCQTCQIMDREVFKRAMQKSPALSNMMMMELSNRFTEIIGRVQELAFLAALEPQELRRGVVDASPGEVAESLRPSSAFPIASSSAQLPPAPNSNLSPALNSSTRFASGSHESFSLKD